MIDLVIRDRLRDRLAVVEREIVTACEQAGRLRSSVTLVAVTKSVPVAVAVLLHELGVNDLAENRPQELVARAQALPAAVRWHQIGHLQRNKVAFVVPYLTCLHAVDSVRLLDAVVTACVERATPLPVLIQVNASREASKFGFAPEDVLRLVPRLQRTPGVDVRGLMTLAAYSDDPEAARPTFALLHQLRDELSAALGRPLPELSMGMSGDFAVAIAEGATLIRLGTTLFEGVQ